MIAAVELIADFTLAIGASFKKIIRAKCFIERGPYQAAFPDEVIELKKDILFAKVLKCEKLIDP